ncbi:hypothetical protein NW762_007473 [Fusarium torreyae]|uniref:Pyrroline-5-carboxylate reductase catalytic N-terminal domain-containing protein n=1 Tax=Fusarium torreyae TaxID=1237075 RepID=A0A9W8S060_9HYPO|nr:hypothetical protein NW762_007473 [Fusarium torreyae]
MKIGIVNAGNLGMSLAVPLAKRGHDVMLSKDTHPDQLQRRMRAFSLERGLNEAEIKKFKYGSLLDAANYGDVVIFSAYFPRLHHVLNELRNAGITFSGKIVIETMNALNVDADFNHYHDFEYMKRT